MVMKKFFLIFLCFFIIGCNKKEENFEDNKNNDIPEIKSVFEGVDICVNKELSDENSFISKKVTILKGKGKVIDDINQKIKKINSCDDPVIIKGSALVYNSEYLIINQAYVIIHVKALSNDKILEDQVFIYDIKNDLEITYKELNEVLDFEKGIKVKECASLTGSCIFENYQNLF